MKAHINIPLPYKLPFKKGLKVVTAYENPKKNFSIELDHYTFYQTEDKEHFEEFNNTLLKVTYIYENDDLPTNSEELLRGIIYNSLGYVNEFLASLRFALNLNYVKNISVYDLPDYIPIDVDGDTYLYITSPMKLINEEETLSSDKLQIAQQNLATWEKFPELAIVDRFFSSAKHKIETEDFLSAIIDLQISFEIFIRNSMRLILKIDGQRQGRPQKEIEKEIEQKNKINFRNVIEHQLSNKLKEKLSFDNHSVVNNWYENLYKIRNEIIHSGRYVVTNDEAQKAYDSYITLRDYITDKLIEKNYLSSEGKVDLRLFEETYSNPKNHQDIQKN